MGIRLSPECTRTPQGGKGTAHQKCVGTYRTESEALVGVCLCGCHTSSDGPPEPPHIRRAERMRADWASGQFRLIDLARRYAVPMALVQGVVYRGRRAV